MYSQKAALMRIDNVMCATKTLLYQILPTYKLPEYRHTSLYKLMSLNLSLMARSYDYLAGKNFRG